MPQFNKSFRDRYKALFYETSKTCKLHACIDVLKCFNFWLSYSWSTITVGQKLHLDKSNRYSWPSAQFYQLCFLTNCYSWPSALFDQVLTFDQLLFLTKRAIWPSVKIWPTVIFDQARHLINCQCWNLANRTFDKPSVSFGQVSRMKESRIRLFLHVRVKIQYVNKLYLRVRVRVWESGKLTSNILLTYVL